MIEPREFLTRVFRAGVEAADPRRATRQAVSALDDLMPAAWIVAVGKGAHAMASGAVEALRQRNASVAGGIVVAHAADANATHGLASFIGDHPTPDVNSLAAADRLGELAARVQADTDAIVLVSGGATSLIAAPVPGIPEADLSSTFAALLSSGADIGLMNAVRKRVLRFGAGRLALALKSRRVHCLIASDVIGNDMASIASGPCVPDAGTAFDTRARAQAAGAWDSLPPTVRAQLDAMADGRAPDVPPADHPGFGTTSARVILDRGDAERGAAEEARRLGATAQVRPEPLSGEAARVGRQFAGELLSMDHEAPACVIWSGESTVSLGASSGAGGRCQEFALSCAAKLEEAGAEASGIVVLAAGTDGRDGPTDAAGAIVDAATCAQIRRAGIDPATALRRHESWHALQSAGALLKTGPTGTNVNDLVVALLSTSDI